MLAFQVGSTLSPGCSTYYPAPCYWPGKAKREAQSLGPWTHKGGLKEVCFPTSDPLNSGHGGYLEREAKDGRVLSFSLCVSLSLFFFFFLWFWLLSKINKSQKKPHQNMVLILLNFILFDSMYVSFNKIKLDTLKDKLTIKTMKERSNERLRDC